MQLASFAGKRQAEILAQGLGCSQDVIFVIFESERNPISKNPIGWYSENVDERSMYAPSNSHRIKTCYLKPHGLKNPRPAPLLHQDIDEDNTSEFFSTKYFPIISTSKSIKN